MSRLSCKLISLFFISILAGPVFALNRMASNLYPESEDTLVVHPATITAKGSAFRRTILPVSLIMAGATIEALPSNSFFSKERIQNGVTTHLDGFSTKADNYLQFAPMAAVFGLKAAGIKSRNDLPNQVILALKSELLMTVVVSSLKYFIHDERPDGSSDNSMPSGHTAQAFVSATLLQMEYRDTSPWIGVGGYLCAAATGFLRMANNRHWASDVLVGAGIGIGTVKLVYLTHKTRFGKKRTGLFVPFFQPKGGGAVFSMNF